jgi:hypothetical protein
MLGPHWGEVTAQQRVLYDCCSDCGYVYAVCRRIKRIFSHEDILIMAQD